MFWTDFPLKMIIFNSKLQLESPKFSRSRISECWLTRGGGFHNLTSRSQNFRRLRRRWFTIDYQYYTIFSSKTLSIGAAGENFWHSGSVLNWFSFKNDHFQKQTAVQRISPGGTSKPGGMLKKIQKKSRSRNHIRITSIVPETRAIDLAWSNY